MARGTLPTRDRIDQVLLDYRTQKRLEFLRTNDYSVLNTKYFIVDEAGREYDSKAVYGVACGKTHHELSGGAKHAARKLERLGYRIIQANTHWYDEELVLVLETDQSHRPWKPTPDHPTVVELSQRLTSFAEEKERVGTALRRSPTHVVAVLVEFQKIAARHERGKLKNASSPKEELFLRYAARALAHGRTQADGRGGTSPSTSPTPTPSSPPSLTDDDLEVPYQGPREIKQRRSGGSIKDDPEKQLRGDRVHEDIRDKLALHLRDHGFEVGDPSEGAKKAKVDYDLGARRGELRLIIESKSLPKSGKAETQRLRVGLGQALWYQQRVWALTGHTAKRRRVTVLLVEREPRRAEQWLAVCRDVGVVLTWEARFGTLLAECEDVLARGWPLP
ncbi:hypothetical protein [Paraliomyxa miuraensis]|uniref:hypothetical protein n=1 Tax=Paraliomyxa miuraensis TaxID=376150 RepID=UPI002259F745|nr:hypothetical protein [Paraliomyxa miuraensis]MCX4247535.1 hypothetical protein [Paraliomyxa miuraensis]